MATAQIAPGGANLKSIGPHPGRVTARILAAALEEAEGAGWYELRLHRVADRAGLSLPEVLAHYRDADAIADALFTAALTEMVAIPPEEVAGRSPSGRAEAVLMRWFGALADNRRVVGEMLRTKRHLSHPHHWVPMAFNLSRLMHWALDAARLDARGLARQAEEVGITLVFLRALQVFPGDDAGLARTRRVLRRGLRFLDRLPRQT
ncbi:MAG TPA: hypothetical protein VE033_18790 [Acetobacteraceae bacterium]|jgi:AcrR family transcriptional regulator|nr:hypothetical protein [Acetobacteraceae bacterium]